LNIWTNISEVINWFTNLDNNKRLSFVIFDIVDFYPTISNKLLHTAIEFAAEHTTITDTDHTVIFNARKMLLYQSGQPWTKKCGPLFDITIGSYDGAECCTLVGIFLLYKINQKFGNTFSLYRDDGLGVTNDTAKNIDKIKKSICKIFQQHNLKFTIEANKKVVNYLDINFDISKRTRKPHVKPNSKIVYVNSKSNHPPHIIRNIPQAINNRLSNLSSNEEVFSQTTKIHQEALTKSGYTHSLTLKPTHTTSRPKRGGRQNITWYNPPFSESITSNLGKQCFKILDEEIPRDHKLYKIFNKNNIKLSYSCCRSLNNIINSHNKKLLNPTIQPPRECNCRSNTVCSIDGSCLTKCIIYQATVTTKDGNQPQTYKGTSDTEFETRFYNCNVVVISESKQETCFVICAVILPLLQELCQVSNRIYCGLHKS